MHDETPEPDRPAWVCRFTLARSLKREPEYLPTLHVVPPRSSFLQITEVLQHALSLGMEAIRDLDPEIGEMIITPFGETEILQFDDRAGERVPAFEQDGWKVFIDWNV